MAQLTKQNLNGKTRYRIVYRNLSYARRWLRLSPGTTKATGEQIARNLTELESAMLANVQPSAQSIAWISGIGGDLRKRLQPTMFGVWVPVRESRSVRELFDEFIEFKKATVKESTLKAIRHTSKVVTKFFLPDEMATCVCLESAQELRVRLEKDYSEATCAKFVKVLRRVWGYAIDRHYTTHNPFLEVRTGNQANPERLEYVAAETIETCIAAASPRMGLILTLARFGGLRSPSEVAEITWDDIDWDNKRVTVRSPKTIRQGKPSRVIPLFSQLASNLTRFERTDGLIVPDAKRNNSQELKRLLTKLDIPIWKRLFQNLRASCETDLIKAGHPAHVVAYWMGHTPAVAMKHYLQVTEDDYRRATE